MKRPKAVMSWSGGKDSAMALQKALLEFEVCYLLTTVNEKWQRISMHGVRRELLQSQAESIGIQLIEVLLPEVASMEVYEEKMNEALDFLVREGITHAIFGDIFLEDLRAYRESKLKEKGVKAVFPLWGKATKFLVEEFMRMKFGAIVVCVDASKLKKSFCGRILDEDFFRDLPEDVDPCGENGEFHTFVFDAPFFRKPIPFKKGDIVYREYDDTRWASKFYFCDLIV
ncbi:MAG: diphthine--ammonia ligase [Pyrinomonadaceae bacterium]|nr:diphthine--ammonia ligase [Pyrinomonadaceae bacterium]